MPKAAPMPQEKRQRRLASMRKALRSVLRNACYLRSVRHMCGLLSAQCRAHHLRSACHLRRARYRNDRAGGRARPRCMRHLHSARHTVRNTITMIQAKPIRSVGANTVPSISALVTVAETGSTVPIRLARTLPMSLTPCI